MPLEAPPPSLKGVPNFDLDQACWQLCQSARGKLALNDLFRLLDNGATVLDGENKQAVFCLLISAFQGRSGSTLESIHRALR